MLHFDIARIATIVAVVIVATAVVAKMKPVGPYSELAYCCFRC